MRKRLRLPLLLAIALAVGILVAGCQASPAPGNPALPPGFKDTLLPQPPLSGYLYARPRQSIAIATSLLTERGSQATTPPASLPATLHAEGFLGWVGPTASSFGLALDVGSPEEAQAVAAYSLAQPGQRWTHQEADHLFLVDGTDPWAQSLRKAIEEGQQTVRLQDAYPQAWEALQWLPANPPAPPVAAGFLQVQGDLLESLATRWGVEAQGLTPALGFLNVETVALGIYGDLPSPIEAGASLNTLPLGRIGGVVAAPTGFPGFLLPWAFGQMEGRSSLEKVSLENGATAYYLGLQPLHVMLGYRGSVVFVGLGASKEEAQRWLSVALGVSG